MLRTCTKGRARQVIPYNVKRYYSSKDDEQVDLTKSFQSFNSTSIGHMHRILGILEDVETYKTDDQDRDNYYYLPFEDSELNESLRYSNKFSTNLGTDILKWNVVKYLNDKEIVARNPQFWQNDSRNTFTLYNFYWQKYRERFTERVRLENGSFLSNPELSLNGRLNLFQTLTKYFIEHDSLCYRKVKKDLRRLPLINHKFSNYSNKFDYKLPPLKIPLVYDNEVINSLILNFQFPTSPSYQLNLLPFILSDTGVLKRWIKIIKSKTLNVGMLKSLIYSSQLEGSIIFKVMIKKKMQLISEPEEHKKIKGFIEDSEEIMVDTVKCIIASKSRLPDRLIYSNDYKGALAEFEGDLNDDQVIISELTGYFDRYFGVLYRNKPKEVDQWAASFINDYIKRFDEEYLNNELHLALKHFRNCIEQVRLQKHKALWHSIETKGLKRKENINFKSNLFKNIVGDIEVHNQTNEIKRSNKKNKDENFIKIINDLPIKNS